MNAMEKKNIFLGGNYQTQFAMLLYKRLMTRKWFSHADVMAEFLSCGSAEKLPTSISKCEGYGELKKAYCTLRKMICTKEGGDAIVVRGNIKNKEFCYVGNSNDPLADMLAEAKEAKYKKNLDEYFQFCQDSEGFFPSSWLEYFFKDTIDAFQIKLKKSRGQELLGSGMNRKHKNIEWLPFIYECIRDKRVLEVRYHQKYQQEVSVIFHPHFLKEANGRWFVYGIMENNDEGDDGYNAKEGQCIPLDRMDEIPVVKKGMEFKPSQHIKYPAYFEDIVGTTKTPGMVLQDICIRIHDRYMFGLVTTKPIHDSQKTCMEFDEKLGYGEVRMQLRPNKEFYGRVLQLGHDLEIVSPLEVREEIKRRVRLMYMRYDDI